MPLCHFQYVNDSTRICIRCRAKIESTLPPYQIRRECSRPDGPALGTKIISVAKAAAAWIAAGSPLRDEQECAKILVICEACENHAGGGCKLCGCNLAAKIRMATENCPADRW